MPCRSGDEELNIPPPTEEQLAKQVDRERIIKERANNLHQYFPIEREFFGSPMSVFLCKAMEIIERYDLMKYTYHEMEWWYREHKYRDEHNNDSKLLKSEVLKKLYDITKQFRIE